VVSSAAASATAADQPALADQLRQASTTVRRGITAMRSLVVDIYPPNLETAGLAAALDDLVSGLRARDVLVHVDLDPEAEARLQLVHQQLVYRVAHETLLNAVRHAEPHEVSIGLRNRGSAVDLEVTDDGRGFDVARVRASPEPGHFGLQVLTDLARDSGADLAVASAPGRGTRWLLRLPDGVLLARAAGRRKPRPVAG
jgi:signal transduction histidine kinase